jgi:hypothetical protein
MVLKHLWRLHLQQDQVILDYQLVLVSPADLLLLMVPEYQVAQQALDHQLYLVTLIAHQDREDRMIQVVLGFHYFLEVLLVPVHLEVLMGLMVLEVL